jgi:hypothetical protein
MKKSKPPKSLTESVTFSERELATVLAALRNFQQSYEDSDGDVIASQWPEHFADSDGNLIPPLDSGEIDELCERINQ